MDEPLRACEGKGNEEMKALKRAHIMILATVFALLVGGTLAFANGFIGGGNDAHGAVVSNSQHSNGNAGENTSGETSTETQQQNQTGSEPTEGAEPTETAKPSVWEGKISSVDCAKGSITITLDSSGQSASAALTSGTQYNVGSCGNLKQGAHVTVEVQSGNAVHVVQDDSGSTGSGGGDGSGSGSGGGDSTPTPGGSK